MNLGENKVFLELVASFHANPNNFCFFVGAGLSQPLFPSWGNLLKTFISKASSSSLSYSQAELNGYIEKGEHYLEVADVCVQALGSSAYRDIMEAEFDKEFLDDAIPDAYRELLKLSPKTIFTTNYDRIPERLSGGRHRVYANNAAPEAARAFAKGQSLVFKIHGDIGINSTIVLTTADYQRVIHKDSATHLFLTSCFSTKTFIFVGFSLSDPHINIILDKLYSTNHEIPISHYVLLNETSQFKIDAFSKRYGLKVIPYSPSTPAHPEVAQFLRALQHTVETSTVESRTPEHLQIDSEQNLFLHVQQKLSEIFVASSTSVFFSRETLYVSFSATGQTVGEIQRELLSALKLFSFFYEPMKLISFNVYIDNKGSVEFREIQSLICTAAINSNAAYDYATKKTATSVVWQEMKFYATPEITDPFGVKAEVRFPLSTGLLND
ncbi:SIR2 family protein [Paraburkholderia fungorum]|uniref:SIR2 family protein n=1 Tax=Paraburkholderia fungorum TaxID=134537 RepID=UPI0038BAF57E